TEQARIEELHVAAIEDRAEAMLGLGGHRELVGELAALATAHPLRERTRALLMMALFRDGRQADALAVYTQTRTLLAEELGIDPGQQLQQLHQRILAGDPVLATPGGRPGTGLPQPHQLPPRSAHFVGRSGELHRLTMLLGTTTGTVLISAINGTAGIGKTTLAVHWAHQVADQFPGGQLYVNLRGFDPSATPLTPAEALHGFLTAFGLPPERIPVTTDERAALYRSLVADRKMLVLLDNARDADQVRPLLPGGPACLVVVTSRNRLISLVSQEGAHPFTLDVLSAEEATALLARRIGADRIAAEPQVAAELIDSCGRLPLALAIVAARAALHPGFPLATLAEELRQVPARLDALDTGDPQANLRAVLSWSVAALSDQAAGVFALLGLAPGPHISLTAAASLIAVPLAKARALLHELEDAHLLQQHVPGSYRMHDLTRQYAHEYACQAQPPDSREAALQRLTGFYLHTAHAAERLLDPSRPLACLGDPPGGCLPLSLTDEAAALAWLDSEHPCLLAAQQQAANQGWHTVTWQFAWALTTYHRRQARRHDQVTAWRAGLAAATQRGDVPACALAHRLLGEACSRTGEHGEALSHLRQALTLMEGSTDRLTQALIHNSLARAWSRQGDDQQALDHATRALHLHQAIADNALEAYTLGDVGWYHARLGHLDQARTHCDAALRLHRRHGNRLGQAAALDSLGYLADRSGEHEQALGWYQEALRLFRGLRDQYNEAEILDHVAGAHAALGQHDRARDTWRQALQLYQAQHRVSEAKRVEQQLAALHDQH
ncbi:MAG TPA: BTAD domain-containing putative transcriptional regulator, partial [Streptosporangiaceae bacterium]|nr:BTAD domain-containing putative transcriptional regulator [Streptosporangiaceae bacterium]